jgi:hypothetical protein
MGWLVQCPSQHQPHSLVFDEFYYVNAARVIDGIANGFPYRAGCSPPTDRPDPLR